MRKGSSKHKSAQYEGIRLPGPDEKRQGITMVLQRVGDSLAVEPAP